MTCETPTIHQARTILSKYHMTISEDLDGHRVNWREDGSKPFRATRIIDAIKAGIMMRQWRNWVTGDVRDHECLICYSKWTSPMQLGEHTASLSGEPIPSCVDCGRNVVASPVRRQEPGRSRWPRRKTTTRPVSGQRARGAPQPEPRSRSTRG